MPDYKETAVTGTQWQRCAAVVIMNPLNGTPTIRMDEEIIANFGGNAFSKSVPGIQMDFDPAMVIPLLNPETGEALGASMTGMEVYVALYSLYIMQAKARDEAP